MGVQGVLHRGDVLVSNGKIESVGNGMDTPSGYEVIEAEGRIVMPGMVDAHTHTGLIESGMGFEGDDINETSDPISPELRAVDGINPIDESFAEGCAAGVTTVATGPGSANPIGGTFAVVKTFGRTLDEMLVLNPVAMKIAFGENPKRVYANKTKTPMTRMATASLIRQWLSKAKEYSEAKERALNSRKTISLPAFDARLEALVPVVRGDLPVKAHAHRADDIMTALRIAEEFNLKITLDHCTEGHLLVPELVKANKGIIVGPSFLFKTKIEVRNRTFKTVKSLMDAGCLVAIMTDLPNSTLSFLPIAAGLAMREGLTETEAMACVTINPACILGLDNRLGSLEPGKDADLIIHDPHPFTDILSRNHLTMIEGRIVYRSDEAP
jgi:imidazolonepropionase-like amidohydrolase